MRIVFFGIYDIGVQSLANLYRRGRNIVAVVTKPDMDGALQPVADWATRNRFAVLQPTSPKEPGFIERIRSLRPDLIAVAGYHKIIPRAILDIPRHGTINLHGSLLPKYRGPCTWKWAIINGESQTGVTVHVMTPTFDNGDILAQQAISIARDDTGGSLFQKICEVGGGLLAETIDALERGAITPKPQNEAEASYYGNPSQSETRIAWNHNAAQIHNLVRGLNPRPGAWTTLQGGYVGVGGATPLDISSSSPPGSILGCSEAGLRVATGSCDLVLTELRLDGSPAIPMQEIQRQWNLGNKERFT